MDSEDSYVIDIEEHKDSQNSDHTPAYQAMSQHTPQNFRRAQEESPMNPSPMYQSVVDD